MRFCVVGNSHVAALRSAYQRDPGEFAGAMNFFAVPGGTQPMLGFEGDTLYPLRERDEVLSDLGEGKRELDTKPFDALILSACGLYAARSEYLDIDPAFHPCAVVGRGDFTDESDPRPDRVPIVSHAVYEAVAASFLEDHASIQYMRLVGEMYGGSVLVQPWPAPSRALRNDPKWFLNAWYGERGPAAWQAYFHAQRSFLSNLASKLGPKLDFAHF